MTKEQFRNLPDKVRWKIGENHARYKQIIRLHKALDTLYMLSSSQEFRPFLPATRDEVATSMNSFRTYLKEKSHTFNVCSNCRPMFRKRPPTKNQKYSINGTCQICEKSITYTIDTNIYTIRHTTSLEEARQFARENYPEYFI